MRVARSMPGASYGHGCSRRRQATLGYVVVQSDGQWLRSIHLVVKELSDPTVIDPSGVVDVGSATWCYRVFSNALLVIEGMTVSMQLSDS